MDETILLDLGDIESLHSLGSEKSEQGPRLRPETEEDRLARTLLREEKKFHHDEPVPFRQFPSLLYAQTEDGTTFDHLKQLTQTKPKTPSRANSQISKLVEDLGSLLTHKLSENENEPIPLSTVDSVHWDKFLLDIISDNLHLSEISDALSQQLQNAILDHLDSNIPSEEGSDLTDLCSSLRSLIHEALSENVSDVPISLSIPVESESQESSSETKPKADSSKDSVFTFHQKIRNLNAHFDLAFIQKELEYLCKPDSVENKLMHRPFESKRNDKFKDEYNLEYADMTFLEKSPKNFIIFNKPGIDCSKLVQKLHDDYGLVVLDPKTVLVKELSNETQELTNELKKGKCISSTVLFKLIMQEIKSSSEVKNNGYILSGIPMFQIGNKELKEDTDVISPDEQLDQIFTLQNKPNIIVYLFCPDPCLIRLRSLTNTDSNTGYEHNLGISRIVKIYEILQAEPPKEANVNEDAKLEEEEEEEEGEEIEEQDTQREKEKHYSQETHDINPKYPNLPDEYVLNFILEDFEDASQHLNSTFKSVKAQNLITNVGLKTIKYYHDIILPLINEYVLSHDPQYYIKLDARFPTRQNFTILQKWLNKICVRKPCMAYPLNPNALNKEEQTAEETEESEEEEDLGEEDSREEEMFKKVCAINNIRSFKWKLSEFGTKCPVSLFYGTPANGKSNFAATYLDKVYFLESKICLEQFILHPKVFIKEPNPKPIFKFMICGFVGTNITDIARNMCTKFHLKYVDFNKLLKKFVDIKRNRTLERFKMYAKNKANESKVLEIIKKNMMEQKILDWKNKVFALINSKFSLSATMSLEEEEQQEEGEEPIFSDHRNHGPTQSMLNILNNSELCKRIRENYTLLDEYVPDNFEEIVERECEQSLDELVERSFSYEFDPRLSLEDIKDAIVRIDNIDQDQKYLYEQNFVNDELPPYRGWVLVGLPIETNLWTVLKDNGVLSNEIVFLYNSNEAPDDENFQKHEESNTQLSNINIKTIDDNSVIHKRKKNLGPNRKELSSIQEKYFNFVGQRDELSILQAPSAFSFEEQTQEQHGENELENEEPVKEKPPKRITFKSHVEIIPVSDNSDQYETNDRILLNWTDVKSTVLPNNSDVITEVDVVQSTDIISQIESHLISKYSYPVVDRSMSQKEDEETKDSNDDSDESIDQQWFIFNDLGDTVFYCPVALKEHKQLTKGNSKHVVQYKNKMYHFKSEKNKEKFKLNPNLYVNFIEPLNQKAFGPLKVCALTTICGSGEFFCKKLASLLDLPLINFNFVFERDIVPPGILPIGVLYEDPTTKFDLAFKDKAILGDLQMLREYFNSCEPLLEKEQQSILVDRYWTFQHPCTDGFLYYRFPHTLTDFKYLVSNMFLPDVFIELKIPEDEINERVLDRVKQNWTAHKGAIKMEIILHDQDIKLKYDEARKRVFHYLLGIVWSREIALKEGKPMDSSSQDILERIEAEIEFARGNDRLLEELMEKYTAHGMENFELAEVDANSLFDTVEDIYDIEPNFSQIKKVTNPLQHSSSIKDIAIRYGLEPEEIDLNVVKQVHKIVCQIVPKPIYKMKSLNQKVNIPDEDIMSTHETELLEISKIKRVAKKLDIPWISSIPSEHDVAKCEFHLKERLRMKDPHVLERLYEVDRKTAEKLLEIGYFYLSKYGRLCPVELHDTKNTIQPYEKRLKRNEIYTLIHRKYIYFIHGESNRNKFKKNVLEYVKFNSTVDAFSCPVKIAIVGAVKSGKSTLAKTLAEYYDLEVITIGAAVRYVKKNLSWTLLADHIEICLTKGCCIPDILVARCIEVLVHVGKAPVMGYVLDGVIANENLILELTKLNIIPHLVIELNVQKEHIFSHLKESSIPERMPLKYSSQFINFKLNTSRFPSKLETIVEKVREYWDNVLTVETITIKLNIDIIVTEINKIFTAINGNYAKMKNLINAPATLKHMCITPYEYDSRLHCLIQNSCVGCMVEKRQFVSKALDRANSVQYKNHFFWLCPQHYLPFLNDPDQFFCNLDPNIFLERPRKIALKQNKYKEMLMNIAENKGYCNVCFWNSFPNRIAKLNKGLQEFAVIYREKIFLFCCECCMQQFCLRPEYYYDKEINCTLSLLPVEQRKPIPPRELPLVGYIYENLAEVVQEALLNVGHLRPKYPFMSPHLSAALYLGYYLSSKIQHKHTCITNTFTEQFQQFLARMDIMLHLVQTLPWDYNPFLIGLWLRGDKEDRDFRRTLKTKTGKLIEAIEMLPT